jgi:hypothetical protein
MEPNDKVLKDLRRRLENGLGWDDVLDSPDNFKKGFDDLKKLYDFSDDFMLNQFESYNRIEEFYNRLNEMLEQALKDENAEIVLEFTGLEDSKPFTLMGQEFVEKWTLELYLKIMDYDWLRHGQGLLPWSSADGERQYLEEFEDRHLRINIEYDLEGMENAVLEYLPSDPPDMTTSIKNPGTKQARRRLSGEAVAEVYLEFTYAGEEQSWVAVDWTDDDKEVSVSDLVINSHVDIEACTHDDDWTVSANSESILFLCVQNYYYAADGTPVPHDDFEMTRTWEEVSDMYRRGDEAQNSTWTLTRIG